MNDSYEINLIKSLFERLREMLEEYRGDNYVAGVQAAIRELSNCDAMPDDRINHAKSIFRNMMGGMGTLGDFVIWDENESRRAVLNLELNKLLAELWDRLEC